MLEPRKFVGGGAVVKEGKKQGSSPLLSSTKIKV
jgi:hypothetical protein